MTEVEAQDARANGTWLVYYLGETCRELVLLTGHIHPNGAYATSSSGHRTSWVYLSDLRVATPNDMLELE